ncbi:MAG: hypothetical protein ACRD6B_25350 [Bryobacteraceae bacterium]
MHKYFARGVALLAAFCLWGATAVAGEPYGECDYYVGYACVTPYLYSAYNGTGVGDYPVQVTPQGGTESVFYTNSNGASNGYIVLIASVGQTWLIAPTPNQHSCGTWTPAYQNWTQNTGFDPNNPGGTVGVPTFVTYNNC